MFTTALAPLKATVTGAAVDILAVDPGVNPSMNAPWMGLFKSLTGMLMGTAIMIAVVGFVLGAILIAVGKLSHTSPVFTGGMWTLFGSIGAGMLIGSASAIIAWSTNQSIWG